MATSTDPSTYKMIHTMIRVSDIEKSLTFYKSLGLVLINKMDIEAGGFCLYYVAYNGPSAPCHGRHWTDRTGVLELTHTYRKRQDENPKQSPLDSTLSPGFSHVTIAVEDVKGVLSQLESAGLLFMVPSTTDILGTATFIKDPDGYHIGIEQARGNDISSPIRSNSGGPGMSRSMIRVKDPVVSLEFYTNVLGMTLVRTRKSPSGNSTTYWVAFVGSDTAVSDIYTSDADQMEGVVELTWIEGTEKQAGRLYHDGNSAPESFGHFCVSVDDLDAACKRFEQMEMPWQKRLNDTDMHDMAFMLDPDGYWIELLQNENIIRRCGW